MRGKRNNTPNNSKQLKTCLRICDHKCLPGVNLYSETYNNDVYVQEAFSYQGVEHRMFIPSDEIEKSLLNGQDSVANHVLKKKQWLQHVESVKGHLKKRKKVLERLKELQSKFSSLSSGVNCIPQTEFDFSRLLKIAFSNPDQEFNGDYNWYYAGGTLSQIAINNDNFLLSTGGKQRDQLRVVRVEENPDWHPVLSSAVKVTASKSHAIHQVLGKCVKGSGLIGVRNKNTCSIYKLGVNNDSLTLLKCHEALSDRAITGFDLNTWKEGSYCSIDTERRVKLWSASKSSYIQDGILEHENVHTSNLWSSVQYGQNRHTLVVADCCCVNIWDTREHFNSSQKISLDSLKQTVVETCEDISLVFPSAQSPHALYVATSHKLLLLDVRAKCTPLQCWTHMMESSPLYGHAEQLTSDKEMVCIASQSPSEVLLAESARGLSSRLILLPMLQDALVLAQTRGHCLAPQHWHRFGLGLTGVASLPVPTETGLDLLTQTVVGDIFCQKVRKANGRSEEDQEKYVEGLVDLNVATVSTQLSASSRHNMEGIYTGLKKLKLKFPGNQSGVLTEPEWRQSKFELQSYTDLLAPKLLEAWDIDSYPEWNKNDNRSTTTSQFDSFSNAVAETETNYASRLTFNLSQDIFSSQIMENDLSFESNKRSFGESANDFESQVGSLFSQMSPKTSKKKKNRREPGY